MHNRDTKYYIENICRQFPDLYNQIPREFEVQNQPPVVFFKFSKGSSYSHENICVGVSF